MCYISAQRNNLGHADIDKIIQVCDALIEARVNEVTLLGGDPAKHPEVIKVAKHLATNGVVVSILSNTLGFKNDELKDVVKHVSSFETTIHSHIPQDHDLFCNSPGAFDRVTEKLKYFSDEGKKTGIAINVTPKTHDALFRIAELLVKEKKINLSYIILQRIIPLGKASEISSYTITRDQAIKSLYEIREIEKQFGIDIVIEDPFPICILPEELHKYIKPCQWGINKVSINAEGDLSRCGADPRYRLGNVLETPLNEIWENSDLLKSFRNKSYLPGRCQICDDLDQCGGGCPLSCEIEKDHGIDYLYSQYEESDKESHGELRFEQLSEQELSSVLQIEWLMFAGYGHVFSVDDIKRWYKHNSSMFYVVKDKRNWILGYTVIVPLTKHMYESVCEGVYSSLIDFPARSVLKKEKSDYYHIEVIATIYGKRSTRAGSFIIRKVGELLLSRDVKHVTASPIKDIGVGLCKYFGFKYLTDEEYKGEKYPIYQLDIKKSKVKRKLDKF
jgi:radical SAM protein with 4Fe4S-binding SPASM domain